MKKCTFQPDKKIIFHYEDHTFLGRGSETCWCMNFGIEI